MIDNYLEVLKKYAVFSGRASRDEFWKFTFVNLLFGIMFTVTGFLDGLYSDSNNLLIVPVICLLIISIPGIAVTVRRLHDTNRSGRCFFLFLIPVIGSVFFLVYMTENSIIENRYTDCHNTGSVSGEVVGMFSVLFVTMMVVFAIFHEPIIDLLLC